MVVHSNDKILIMKYPNEVKKMLMKFPLRDIVVSILSFLNGTRQVDSKFANQSIAGADMAIISRVNIH